MEGWIYWMIIALFLFAYTRVRKSIKAKIEEEKNRVGETDFSDTMEAEYEEGGYPGLGEYESIEYESQEMAAPPLTYRPIDTLSVEGGRPTLEVLVEVTPEEEQPDSEESPYTAENIHSRIRDGVILKEILDRKYS